MNPLQWKNKTLKKVTEKTLENKKQYKFID